MPTAAMAFNAAIAAHRARVSKIDKCGVDHPAIDDAILGVRAYEARRVKLSIDERQLPRCEDEVPCANRGDVGGQWAAGCRQRATEFDEPLMDQRMCHEFVLSARTLEVRDEVLRVGPEQFERAPTRLGRSCRGWPLCCE